MKWEPDVCSKIPLYMQLANYIRSEIKLGNFKSGSKFPGRNKVAATLKVSRNTVVAAYDQLINEGLLLSHPQSGIFVKYTHEADGVNWQQYTARARHKTSTEEYRHWGNADGLTNFSIGSDFNVAPYLKKVTENVMKRLEKGVEHTGFSKYGLPSLRESLCEHLKMLNIHTRPENVLITSETFQRLYFVYETIMAQSSHFLYEKTNIISTISNIHSLRMNMMPVKMDRFGMLVSDLKDKAAKSMFNTIVHLDPTDQAPTGIVMSKRRRQDLMKVVQEHNLPMVEIDHSANIWHDKPALNPLKSMDEKGNVIYMGSFLKYFPFDFQVSWVVADAFVIEHLSNVFLQSGVRTNYYMQMLVDELIRTDTMPMLRAATKNFVMERREQTLSLCEKYLKPMCEWEEKNSYFHFWLNFPEMDFKQFKNKTFFKSTYPGYLFDRDDRSHVLLCPACIKHDDIENSIKALSKAISC